MPSDEGTPTQFSDARIGGDLTVFGVNAPKTRCCNTSRSGPFSGIAALGEKPQALIVHENLEMFGEAMNRVACPMDRLISLERTGPSEV